MIVDEFDDWFADAVEPIIVPNKGKIVVAHTAKSDDNWFAEAYNGPTTDQMGRRTPAGRYALVAFCEHCELWWEFVKDMTPTREEATCPTCGGKQSNRVGFQVTSQRTFNAVDARKKKLPRRR